MFVPNDSPHFMGFQLKKVTDMMDTTAATRNTPARLLNAVDMKSELSTMGYQDSLPSGR